MEYSGEYSLGFPAEVQNVNPGQVLRILVVVGFLVALLAVLIFGVGLLMRWGRRMTREGGRRRSPPTDSTDVWSMHVLPDTDLPVRGTQAGQTGSPGGKDAKPDPYGNDGPGDSSSSDGDFDAGEGNSGDGNGGEGGD